MKLADRKTSCGPYETLGRVRHRGKFRPVMAHLYPQHMTLRLKGCRDEMAIPYDTVYWHALAIHVNAAKREKMKARPA